MVCECFYTKCNDTKPNARRAIGQASSSMFVYDKYIAYTCKSIARKYEAVGIINDESDRNHWPSILYASSVYVCVCVCYLLKSCLASIRRQRHLKQFKTDKVMGSGGARCIGLLEWLFSFVAEPCLMTFSLTIIRHFAIEVRIYPVCVIFNVDSLVWFFGWIAFIIVYTDTHRMQI